MDILLLILNADERVNHYCQIGTTQCYYLLQSYLATYLYGDRFNEAAHPGHSLANSLEYEGLGINFKRSHMKNTMEHIPWWLTGNWESEKFDIITMNAMLQELSPEALDLYLDLAHKNLKDDGFVVVQCLGKLFKIPTQKLLTTIYNKGFSLQITLDGYPTEGSRYATENMVLTKDYESAKLPKMPLDEMIKLAMERENEKLFSAYYRNKDSVLRKSYSKQDLINILSEKYIHLSPV